MGFRTSSRAAQKDLYKITPLGSPQDRGQELHARTPKRISQGCHKRICCCHKSFHKHLQDMASARTSCKDLLERTPPKSPQGLLLRTCTRSCEDLLEEIKQDLHKSPFMQEFAMKMLQAKSLRTALRTLFVQACAVDMHMDLSQEPLQCANLHETCRAPRSRRAVRASLRNRNAHGHVTRAILCANSHEKYRRQIEHPDLTPLP